MLSSLSSFVVRRPRLVIAVWFLAALLIHVAAPSWEDATKDDDVRFFPADYPSVVGQDLLERGFPLDSSSSSLVILYERKDARVTPGDLAYIETSAAELSAFAAEREALGVKKIDTHRSPVIGRRLIGRGRDGHGEAVLTIVSLKGTYLSRKTRHAVDEILKWLDATAPKAPAGLTRWMTGSALVGHDTNAAASQSIKNTTDTTVALVILILLMVYRSPLLAMVPLVAIAVAVFGSLRLIALLTLVPALQIQVIGMTRVFVIVVLFGAGTDYCLFLVARYREELVREVDRSVALERSIQHVGGALVASAGTVIVGLGMLYFSSFAKVRSTGPTIALALSLALLASLTLAPALMSALGGRLFWPWRGPPRPKVSLAESEELPIPDEGFWGRVADFVVASPALILGVCLVVLVPLAVVGAMSRSNHNQLDDLPQDSPGVLGARVVERFFPVGELSPAIVLVDNPRIDFGSAAGRTVIDELGRRLLGVAGVADVRSAAAPLGAAGAATAPASFLDRARDQTVAVAALSRYVSLRPARPEDHGHITRLDVVFKSDPFSTASRLALDQVRRVMDQATGSGEPLEGARSIGVSGSTMAVSDLRRVTASDERRMYVLVTLGVYIVLVALLRRPGICLYLIATVVLGYLASLGLTEMLFHALHRGPTPWGGLDWTVGFFLFVILVAVGEDYNIFLMSRVIEEEKHHGLREGTRRAVARTGGVVSSCGVIMAGTFGSMLTGSLTSLRELGFALGLGVLLDTFLVRPILVPAFVVLVDRLKRLRSEKEDPREAEMAAARALGDE